MIRTIQKRLLGGCCLFALMASSFAQSIQCPSQDFKTFFNAFSENLEVQKAFTPETFKRSYLSINEGLGNYDLFAEKVHKKDLTFPIIVNANKRKELNYVVRISANKESDRLMNVDIYEDESDVG